jgi:diaminohydroxyphosphoribosylaminopyrimidine deaminase / 5-amino-6-(5-phosphoribosylamino)uracil reductase
MTREDRLHMARALELARRGLYTTDPNPRVGCVLVRGGETLAEGWHERAGQAHAEVAALRAACGAASGPDAAPGGRAAASEAAGETDGATAYVTLEPCSHTGRTGPCADALIAAGIRRVVCASVDPNPLVAGRGVRRLEAAGVDVTVGVLEAEARALNPGFFSRFERGRPYLRLKLAMSLDGRTAPAGGGARWISGEASRADVQHWRARSSAVLTGAGTVRSDDPRLDVRLAYGEWVRQPRRVVLDAALGTSPEARVFAGGGALVFAAEDAPRAAVDALAARGVEVLRVPAAGGRLDLAAVLGHLAARETNELLAECGPRLAGSLLETGLVDELIVYVAPALLGADALPLTALEGRAAERLAAFEIVEVERIDADVRITLRPGRSAPPARLASS